MRYIQAVVMLLLRQLHVFVGEWGNKVFECLSVEVLNER
jgi:hypothetical protein